MITVSATPDDAGMAAMKEQKETVTKAVEAGAAAAKRKAEAAAVAATKKKSGQ